MMENFLINEFKYTKAELISKIQGLNKNKPEYFTNFLGTILLLKNFLLKITLIALIIKIFKKFSIFRRI
jgi:hypothetical protein